jgi:hypothetical protein
LQCKKEGFQQIICQAGIHLVITNVYQTYTRFYEYPADYQQFLGIQLVNSSHFTYTRRILPFTDRSVLHPFTMEFPPQSQ